MNAPAGLKKFMTKADKKFQLVPPHRHRTKHAEKAIGTFKENLIASICSYDPSSPMHLWDRNIPQATLTLNLLRPSRINPRLSSEAQLNGPFNFNATPLSPPGTKVLIYDTPEQRRSWAPHGVDGGYVGLACEHYWCYRVYVPTTRAKRVAKTVQFFPKNCPVPKLSSADNAARAAQELTEALLNPAPAAPFAMFGDETMMAIRHLATIFAEAPPSTSKYVPPPVLSTVYPP